MNAGEIGAIATGIMLILFGLYIIFKEKHKLQH